MSRATSVLFPAPGGPVTPITWAGRSAAGMSISHGGVFSTSVIARASGSQLSAVCWASRSACSSAGADKRDLPVEDLVAHHALRRLADAGERQPVDERRPGGPLEARQLGAAEAQQVAGLEWATVRRHRDHHG